MIFRENFIYSTKRIILASASPRRKELLSQVGLNFESIPSLINEDIREGETPEEHVLRLALYKAREISKNQQNSLVIGADTVVVLDGKILGKPQDEKEAFEMLSQLSGREHKVYTGFCVRDSSNDVECSKVVESRVRFKQLTSEEIEGYIKSGEPMDKAGAYAIQGKGSYMIKEIQGSYTNVVGLPLCELIEVLINLGAIKFKI